MSVLRRGRQLDSLIFFYAISMCLVLESKATFDPNLMCSLLVNGTKIKDPRACNTWIECIDGQPITGSCTTANYFYDRATMECVPAGNIQCISSNACATTTADKVFVADPNSCNGYYYCTNGVGSHGYCNEGMNFNPGTQDCIRGFPCVEKMNPDSYCNIVPDGVLIKNVANCNGYQTCWDGVVINNTCPGTFNYDAINGICDYPKNVPCVETVTNPPNAPDPSTECTKNFDFIADNDSCNGYYICLHSSDTDKMELIHGTCEPGRFFNPDNGGSCISRTQISCNFDRCVGLGNYSIQLANLSDDDCRGYALCQDGAVISTGKCPENEYFDETQQRCTNQQISFPACASTKSTSIGDELEPTTDSSASSDVDFQNNE